MTASALLTVVGVALVMEAAGLSAALGAFIAGVLLADSEYRHEIEADIAPFEGLLLGLFFIAVGMSIDLSLIAARPVELVRHRVGLRCRQGRDPLSARTVVGPRRRRRAAPRPRHQSGRRVRLRAVAPARWRASSSRPLAELLTLAVTLSMAATPVLLLIDDAVNRALKPAPPRLRDAAGRRTATSSSPASGAFGQIVARILRATRIPFTALDSNVAQVDFVKRFGAQIYYGDAGRLDILRAAQDGQGAGLRAGHRQCREFAQGRRDGAARISPMCRSMPARATAPTCTG